MDHHIKTVTDFPDYELLDSGNGRKLERFGNYILNRIETQALWKPSQPDALWQKADAVFRKRDEKHGQWVKHTKIPDQWQIEYKNLKLWIKLTPFGHVGVFPEQSEQWEWIEAQIKKFEIRISKSETNNDKNSKQFENSNLEHSEIVSNFEFRASNFKILSLFSYTGAATLAAAAAGAHVTHVDASKPAITWARENQQLSGLEQKPIRWIVDDALKFVKREVRRGNRYHGIIMDPPKFGRGAQGEVWKFEENFVELLDYCRQILHPNGFLLITAYAVPISPITLANTVQSIFKQKQVEFGELGLEETNSKRILPTAIFVRG